MKKEKQVKFLSVVFRAISFGTIFVLLGQYVGMLETKKYMASIGQFYEPSFTLLQFSLLEFWIPVLIGATIGFCIVWFIPVIDWGVKLARKWKAKPGGLGFSLIIGLAVACVMVPILGGSMSILTTVVLVPEGEYRATVSVALVNAVRYLWIFFPVAWLFGVAISKPYEKLARIILKVPASQSGHHVSGEAESVN